MKFIHYWNIILFSLISFICCCKNANKLSYHKNSGLEIRYILNRWSYSHSTVFGRHIQLDSNVLFLPPLLLFSKNKENNIIKNRVNDNRKYNNMLDSISLTTFNRKNVMIDSFYSIAQKLGDKYELTNYGLKYKFEFFIIKLNKDSLILSDNRVYTINGVKQYNVEHIYIKQIRLY